MMKFEKKLNLREMKDLLLEILIFFDRFCRQHNLIYYLGGGTLLGAIRHQGFIPWDDDIDVMMPREDYEKFLRLFVEHEQNQARYDLEEFKRTPEYVYPFLKIIDKQVVVRSGEHDRVRTGLEPERYNLFIDIFPLDGVPNTERKQRLFFFQIQLLKLCRSLSIRRLTHLTMDTKRFLKIMKSIAVLPVVFLSRILGYRFFLNRLDVLTRTYPFTTSTYVAACTGFYGIKEVVPRDVFFEAIPIMFEGHEFFAPLGYDLYLKKHYGNYMQLPEETKRVNHFDGEVYLLQENSGTKG
jgi:lipopolysaccharide cholinephosphotransferase